MQPIDYPFYHIPMCFLTSAGLGGTPGKYDIRLQQPLTFTYATSRTQSGETAIRWPDCFDISGNVQLGPGVDPERMAFEWIVNVRPVGRLRCVDPGTCKKDW